MADKERKEDEAPDDVLVPRRIEDARSDGDPPYEPDVAEVEDGEEPKDAA